MLGCIALVAGPGARLALLQPMLEPLAAHGGQAGLASGPELIAAMHQPGPGGPVNGMAGRLAGQAEISAAMTMLPLLRRAHDLGVPAVLAGHGAAELFGRMLPGYVLAGYRHDGQDRPRRVAGRARAPLSPRQAAQVYRSLGYDLLEPWPGPASQSTTPATPATPVTGPELHCAQARP